MNENLKPITDFFDRINTMLKPFYETICGLYHLRTEIVIV